MNELERAWAWRESRGLLIGNGALRVFHGPGEGTGPLREIAIDRFGPHAWVTFWKDEGPGRVRDTCGDFLQAKGFQSAVELSRPERGLPAVSRVIFGDPPEDFEAFEGPSHFLIRFKETRHPGLFLDHEPLRAWLMKHARGLRVLNTFAYTGSLSVAAGRGGAAQVTTLDLSGATIDWAKANWTLNGLGEAARFIAGDVFEWLPRFGREGTRFDCVILDPPSFSRGKKGTFSTAKDLARLHELALALVEPGGILITSINSANIPRERYRDQVAQAARNARAELLVLESIDLPTTFPTRLDDPEARYLKGWIFRRLR